MSYLVVKVPIIDDRLTAKKRARLEALTGRDTTIIKRYLEIIEQEEENLWAEGLEGKRLREGRLDQLTMTTKDRPTVPYDLKAKFGQKITTRELYECRDMALSLWHDHLTKFRKWQYIQQRLIAKAVEREDELPYTLAWWDTKKPARPCQSVRYKEKKIPRMGHQGKTVWFQERETTITRYWLEYYYWESRKESALRPEGRGLTIYRCLQEHGPLTVQAIGKHLKLSCWNVFCHIRELAKHDLVTRVGTSKNPSCHQDQSRYSKKVGQRIYRINRNVQFASWDEELIAIYQYLDQQGPMTAQQIIEGLATPLAFVHERLKMLEAHKLVAQEKGKRKGVVYERLRMAQAHKLVAQEKGKLEKTVYEKLKILQAHKFVAREKRKRKGTGPGALFWVTSRKGPSSISQKGFQERCRLWLPLNPSAYHLTQLGRGEIKVVQLVKHWNKRWYAHLTIAIPEAVGVEEEKPLAVLGIDLGMDCPAAAVLVTASGKQCRFFKQPHKKGSLDRLSSKKASLESTIFHRQQAGTSTKNLTKAAKNIGRTRHELARQYDHELTADIARWVAEVRESYDLHVAIGRLKGIFNIRRKGDYGSQKGRKRLHNWSYGRVTKYLQEKLRRGGLPEDRLSLLSEAGTSQTCSRCGSRDTRRPSQALFLCHACGLQLNADENGATNIAFTLIHLLKEKGETPLDRWLPKAPVDKSSTSKPSGESGVGLTSRPQSGDEAVAVVPRTVEPATVRTA
ncbi:MAG: zinc ribbon domain-containing protein [Candidatus Heimdallarchaeota archaeon]